MVNGKKQGIALMRLTMKWMIWLTTLLLTACGLNTADTVAYRQVIVPTPTHKIKCWSDSPTMDVTTHQVKYL